MWQMQHTTIKYHQEHGMGDANYSSKEDFPLGEAEGLRKIVAFWTYLDIIILETNQFPCTYHVHRVCHFSFEAIIHNHM
jgi:hypothetical protein